MSIVDELLDQLCQDADGDFVPALAAEKLARELHEKHEQELLDWLDEHAVSFLREAITFRLRRSRGKAVRRAAARAFGKATDEGDDELLGHFAVFHVVAPDRTQKRVADMTGEDHRFVADAYQATGKYDLMLAAFHRQVAKAVGKKRTADVLSEEQYDELLQSITKRMSA